MTTGWYSNALEGIMSATIDLDNDTIKLMLCKSGYVHNVAHVFVDDGGANDPIDHEITVTNYARQTCTVTVVEQSGSSRAIAAISDAVFSSLATGETITQCILFKDAGGADTANPLICQFDLTSTATNGGNVTIDFATSGAGGNLRITAA